MIYRVLADGILVLHVAFVFFVVLGGLLLLRWPKLVWLHLPSVLWSAGAELAGWFCPLTPLENALRRLGGEAGYQGGFIEHYLLPMIYPHGLTRGAQLALGIGVVALNGVIYAVVLARRRQERKRGKTGVRA